MKKTHLTEKEIIGLYSIFAGYLKVNEIKNVIYIICNKN